MSKNNPVVLILMGVAGCGKTTVGKALAARLDCPFYDGDDFHPPENLAKMANGIPLEDVDRLPWLTCLHDLIHDHLVQGEAAVFACSALKKRYRDLLRSDNRGAIIIYLQGERDLIQKRLQSRQGHFMKTGMLESQFEALEAPSPDEAILVDITGSVEGIIQQILAHVPGSSKGRS